MCTFAKSSQHHSSNPKTHMNHRASHGWRNIWQLANLAWLTLGSTQTNYNTPIFERVAGRRAWDVSSNFLYWTIIMQSVIFLLVDFNDSFVYDSFLIMITSLSSPLLLVKITTYSLTINSYPNLLPTLITNIASLLFNVSWLLEIAVALLDGLDNFTPGSHYIIFTTCILACVIGSPGNKEQHIYACNTNHPFASIYLSPAHDVKFKAAAGNEQCTFTLVNRRVRSVGWIQF